MVVKVSSNGRIVIPAERRKRYGNEPNSRIEFIDTGEEIVIVPLAGKDPVRSTYGILREVSSRDVIGNRRRERRREKGMRGTSQRHRRKR